MLRLLNYDKAFIPAKRNYDRQPFSKVAYQVNNEVDEMIICNN